MRPDSDNRRLLYERHKVPPSTADSHNTTTPSIHTQQVGTSDAVRIKEGTEPRASAFKAEELERDRMLRRRAPDKRQRPSNSCL
jgi:hypothetical protein